MRRMMSVMLAAAAAAFLFVGPAAACPPSLRLGVSVCEPERVVEHLRVPAYRERAVERVEVSPHRDRVVERVKVPVYRDRVVERVEVPAYRERVEVRESHCRDVERIEVRHRQPVLLGSRHTERVEIRDGYGDRLRVEVRDRREPLRDRHDRRGSTVEIRRGLFGDRVTVRDR